MTGMKQSTIKIVLRKKLKNWLSTIEDPTLREKLSDNVIVCGGSIASLLLGEKPNDYDLYFRTKEASLSAAIYYSGRFNRVHGSNIQVKEEDFTNIKGIVENRIILFMKSSGVESEARIESKEAYKFFELYPESDTEDYMDSLSELSTKTLEDKPEEVIDALNVELAVKTPYRPVFLSDNAITLSDKMQLIIRFYGEPIDIFENFDFAHAMCYFDYRKDELVCPHEALESLLSKNLDYKGSLYPLASIFRIRKFINRGWRISVGQMLKILWQVNELNLKDPVTLRDQLIGVDTAYMHQLINALQQEKPTTRIDSTYIANLIDKIFD